MSALMSALDLKVPPPVIGLLTAGGMWAVSRWLPAPEALAAIAASSAASWRAGAALVIAAGGAWFDVAGLIAFRRARTTVNPMKPENSTSLVSTGIYRVTRNPMYVGMALILLAWAVFLASPWALAGPLVFAIYITRFQIQPEERAMADRFGSVFAAYCARVRRWL